VGSGWLSGGTAVRGLLALLLVAAAGCGARALPVCAPHDTLCQAQLGRMADPACKNGKAGNDKCLDPRAPP
jgi:hypothetical protein